MGSHAMCCMARYSWFAWMSPVVRVAKTQTVCFPSFLGTPLRRVVMCNPFLSRDGMFTALVRRILMVFSLLMFFLVQVPHHSFGSSLKLESPSPPSIPHCCFSCSRLPCKPNCPSCNAHNQVLKLNCHTYCNRPVASRI